MGAPRIIDELKNMELCDALLKQDEAHRTLIAALQARIKNLEIIEDSYTSRSYATYAFISSQPELIKPYIEFLYASIGDFDGMTREDVICEARPFHETDLDLSTLPCTGSDFRPWKD